MELGYFPTILTQIGLYYFKCISLHGKHCNVLFLFLHISYARYDDDDDLGIMDINENDRKSRTYA